SRPAPPLATTPCSNEPVCAPRRSPSSLLPEHSASPQRCAGSLSLTGEAMTELRRVRIAVIPGDGIGQEVVPEGLRILNRVAEHTDGGVRFEYERFPWGCQ